MARVRTETLITTYQADASQLLSELRKLDKSAKATAQGMRGLNQRLDRAGNAFRKFSNAARLVTSGYILTRFVRETAQAANLIGEFGDKLEFAQLRFNSFANSDVGVSKVANAADKLGLTIDELGQSVNLFIPAFDRIGVSFDEGIDFINNLTNSMRVFGVEAVSASRASIQLAQAVGSSRLYGEELRSLQENAGGLAAQFERAVTNILGINKPLRILGAEGKITADVFYEGWQQVFAELDGRIREIPETIKFQKNRVRNAAAALATAFNEAFNIDEKVEATLGYIQQLLLNFAVDIGSNIELVPTSNLEQQLVTVQARLAELQQLAPESFREAQELIETGTEGMTALERYFAALQRKLSPFLDESYNKLVRLQKLLAELTRRGQDPGSTSEGDMLEAERQSEAVNAALKEREQLWKRLLTLTREELQLDEKIAELSQQKRQLIDIGGSQQALNTLEEQLLKVGNRFEYVTDEARAVGQQLLRNGEFLENMGAATAELAAKERKRNSAFMDLLDAREYDKAQAFIEEQIKAREKENRILEEQNELLAEAREKVSDEYKAIITAYDEKAAAAIRYQEVITAIKNAEAAGEGTAERRAELLEKATHEFKLVTDAAYKFKNAVSTEVAEAFGSWIDSAIDGTFKLRDALDGLLKDLAKMALRMAAMNFLESAFPNFFTKNATGNPFPTGTTLDPGVYDRPTFFKFARGGVLGEAGPEAVLPLARMPSGDLGVQSQPANVVVNVVEKPGGEAGTVKQRQGEGGKTIIDVMVDKVRSELAMDVGRGKGLAPVLERQYGLSRTPGGY